MSGKPPIVFAEISDLFFDGFHASVQTIQGILDFLEDALDLDMADNQADNQGEDDGNLKLKAPKKLKNVCHRMYGESAGDGKLSEDNL